MTNRSIRLYLSVHWSLLLLLQAGTYIHIRALPSRTADPVTFDGQRAYADVETQVAFGPRMPGTEGHAKIQEWMREELVAGGLAGGNPGI